MCRYSPDLPVFLQSLTGPFCNLKGDTCVDDAPGFGTLTVTDNFGTGPNRAFTWSSCNDEHHFTGDAANDPCVEA